MNSAQTSIRWIGFLPAGFVASIVGGLLLATGGRVLGTWQWAMPTLSGFGSAIAFFIAAFAVAPKMSQFTKWASVFCVGSLGTMSALGPILLEGPVLDSLSGAAMVISTAVIAFTPLSSLMESFPKSSEKRAE